MRLAYIFVLISIGLASCDGGRETKREYHENGSLAVESVWQDGKKNGMVKRYFPGGKLEFEGMYENDLRTGWHTVYYENGNVRQRSLHKIVNEREMWEQELQYDEQGTLISDLKYARKDLEIDARAGEKYSEGGTIIFKVKVKNPKYPYVEGQ